MNRVIQVRPFNTQWNRLKWIYSALLALVLFGFLAGCGEIREPQFITSDIELFWDVYDRHDGVPSVMDIEDEYIAKGTIGLQDFSEQKNLPPGLNAALRSIPKSAYYEDIRSNTENISGQISDAKKALLRLTELFPDTRISDVYFLIGGMSAGGRISSNGLLIAVEMFAKNENTSLNGLSSWLRSVLRDKDNLPSIVVHESIHIQQLVHSGNTTYQTTLEKSIQEGMADFITLLVLEELPFFNQHLHEYGDPREEELWRQFEREMDIFVQGTEWLYTGSLTEEGHPADMGYYVGYKIIEAYAATFPSVEEAVKAMLTTSDYIGIFETSKYDEKFQ